MLDHPLYHVQLSFVHQRCFVWHADDNNTQDLTLGTVQLPRSLRTTKSGPKKGNDSDQRDRHIGAGRTLQPPDRPQV